MKKIFIMSLLGAICLAGEVHAQLPKGTKYWGATINLTGETSKTKNEDNTHETFKTNSHSIGPEVQCGVFVTNSTMIGLGLRYNVQLSKTRNDDLNYKWSYTNQSFDLLPFVRKYKSLGERWSVFLHGEIGPGYAWSKTTIKGTNASEDKGDVWYYRVNIKPGVVYTFPKKKWSVEAYTNLLSLDARYFPHSGVARQFYLGTAFSSGFPSYFSLRLAKYISVN